jgi:hypothetical protein
LAYLLMEEARRDAFGESRKIAWRSARTLRRGGSPQLAAHRRRRRLVIDW